MLPDAHPGACTKWHPCPTWRWGRVGQEAVRAKCLWIGKGSRIAVQLPQRDSQHGAFGNVPAAERDRLYRAPRHQGADGWEKAHRFFQTGRQPRQFRQVPRAGVAPRQHHLHFLAHPLRHVGMLRHQMAPPQQGGGGGFMARLEVHQALIKHLGFTQTLAGFIITQTHQHRQQVVTGRGVRGQCLSTTSRNVSTHQLPQETYGTAFGRFAWQRQPVWQGDRPEHFTHGGFTQRLRGPRGLSAVFGPYTVAEQGSQNHVHRQTGEQRIHGHQGLLLPRRYRGIQARNGGVHHQGRITRHPFWREGRLQHAALPLPGVALGGEHAASKHLGKYVHTTLPANQVLGVVHQGLTRQLGREQVIGPFVHHTHETDVAMVAVEFVNKTQVVALHVAQQREAPPRRRRAGRQLTGGTRCGHQ